MKTLWDKNATLIGHQSRDYGEMIAHFFETFSSQVLSGPSVGQEVTWKPLCG